MPALQEILFDRFGGDMKEVEVRCINCKKEGRGFLHWEEYDCEDLEGNPIGDIEFDFCSENCIIEFFGRRIVNHPEWDTWEKTVKDNFHEISDKLIKGMIEYAKRK